jgi:predicted GNAT family acetyltransferase
MKFVHKENEIVGYDENQKEVAKVTFPSIGGNMVDVDHTVVDESLKGQGVAGKLMEEVAKDMKETNRKAKLSCSYAVAYFARHPEKKTW